MRTFKFRAWDERNKVMHHDFEFIRSGEGKDNWIIFKSNKQPLKDGKVFDNSYVAEQLKIMQYTGVKDMNGKEIYEGDIVEYISKRGWQDDKKEFDVIKFRDGEFYPRLDKNEYHTYRYTNFKVLGNIYENPELLELLDTEYIYKGDDE